MVGEGDGMGLAAFDVVVVGAGMAGLTAARGLLERGLSVCVVEARERVGGRILSERRGDVVVEMGAEFVHGRPPELWALIEEAGLETYELDGAQVEADGEGGWRDGSGEEDDRFAVLEELEGFAGPDCGFIEYADRIGVTGDERAGIVSFVEGFNAADARVASVMALGAQQAAEGAIEGDRMWHVRGGYARVPEYLAGRVTELGGVLRLGFAVDEVRWERGRAAVLGRGEEIRAGRAVVTVPVGVLQAGTIRFVPEPQDRLELAGKLRMGQVCRFTMVFRERFWAERAPAMSFLFSFEETPSVWWTPYPDETAMLTGWVGGPRSDALAGLSAEELGAKGCEVLGRAFGMDVRELLVSCAMHDWRGDAWTLGAYSYIAAGELDTPRRMGEPVEETLYFAGEHTDVTGHWGTVHAAMRSGLRVVEQIIAG
jgi:monoamine oxidase